MFIALLRRITEDLHDNFFLDSRIGRFPGIDEDEPALVRLVSEG